MGCLWGTGVGGLGSAAFSTPWTPTEAIGGAVLDEWASVSSLPGHHVLRAVAGRAPAGPEPGDRHWSCESGQRRLRSQRRPREKTPVPAAVHGPSGGTASGRHGVPIPADAPEISDLARALAVPDTSFDELIDWYEDQIAVEEGDREHRDFGEQQDGQVRRRVHPVRDDDERCPRLLRAHGHVHDWRAVAPPPGPVKPELVAHGPTGVIGYVVVRKNTRIPVIMVL